MLETINSEFVERCENNWFNKSSVVIKMFHWLYYSRGTPEPVGPRMNDFP